jgi:phage shock protein PspC (stress-responsive transcriptional regulator)
MPVRRLTRSRTDGQIAGVCAGLATYFDVDVVLIRAAWEATEPDTAPLGRRLTRSNTDRKIAGVCGGLAEYYGVDATPIRLLWVILSILCGAVIGGVLAYLVAWLIIPRRHDVLLPTPAPASPA